LSSPYCKAFNTGPGRSRHAAAEPRRCRRPRTTAERARFTTRSSKEPHLLRCDERLMERLRSQPHPHAAPRAAPCPAAAPAAPRGSDGPSPHSAHAGCRSAPSASGAAAAAAAGRAVGAGQPVSAGGAAGTARGVRAPVEGAPVEGELDSDGRRRAQELGAHRGRGRAGCLDRLRHLLRAPMQASGAREGSLPEPYCTCGAAARPAEVHGSLRVMQPPRTQFPSAACR